MALHPFVQRKDVPIRYISRLLEEMQGLNSVFSFKKELSRRVLSAKAALEIRHSKYFPQNEEMHIDTAIGLWFNIPCFEVYYF